MTVPEDDIDRIMGVMNSAFDPAYGEAWNRRQVIDALTLSNCSYCIIDGDGRFGGEADCAGFTLIRHGFEEDEVLLIAVKPQYRDRGFGRKLLENLIKTAKDRGSHRVLLEMRRGNPAESLYRKVGFVQIGERLGYYRTNTGNRLDAATFALQIA